MNKNWLRWLFAVIITLSAAVYQKLTGPTYPVSGKASVDGMPISYKFDRSHGGPGDQLVHVTLTDTSYQVLLAYRRFKVDTGWTYFPMKYEEGSRVGYLPHQPPAGKLEYFVMLKKGIKNWTIPPHKTVVTRFKGAVPLGVLIPHISFMFLAMLFSVYTAFLALVKGAHLKGYVLATFIILVLGGLVLGPFVQKYAFDAYWTGIPFGFDLTDNKTLFAAIGWLIALFAAYKLPIEKSRWWIVGAAILLLIVFSIPHSAMGSELNYKTMQVVTG